MFRLFKLLIKITIKLKRKIIYTKELSENGKLFSESILVEDPTGCMERIEKSIVYDGIAGLKAYETSLLGTEILAQI